MSSDTIEELGRYVREIDAVNHAWKLAQDRLGPQSPLAVALRERKSGLQLSLLRDHPGAVTLVPDGEGASQPVYGIVLREPVAGRGDAAHIPVEVVKSRLPVDLLARLGGASA